MFKFLVIVIGVGSFLAGCASIDHTRHKLSEFRYVSNPHYLSIARFLFQEPKADSGSEPFMQGLAPGRYISVLENREGTLFLGKEGSYFFHSIKDGHHYYSGGFWVPKEKGEAPRLFYILANNSPLKGGSQGMEDFDPDSEEIVEPADFVRFIVSSQIRSENDRIVFVPVDDDFIEKLQLERSPIPIEGPIYQLKRKPRTIRGRVTD